GDRRPAELPGPLRSEAPVHGRSLLRRSRAVPPRGARAPGARSAEPRLADGLADRHDPREDEAARGGRREEMVGADLGRALTRPGGLLRVRRTPPALGSLGRAPDPFPALPR